MTEAARRAPARAPGLAKSIEALARGYVLFRVGDRRFLSYASARAEYEAAEDASMIWGVGLSLDGFHIWKGWRCFRYLAGPVFLDAEL